MSLRLIYAGETDIFIGRSGGGSVVFSPPVTVTPPSYPEYGTLIQSHTGRLRQVSEGGSYVSYNGSDFANSYWDVNELANGTGGSFFDWNSAVFSYYATGQFDSYSDSSQPIVINGTSYGGGCSYSGSVNHDGNGGYYTEGTGGGCISSGEVITTVSNPTYLSIDGSDYQNGYDVVTYRHDGSGSYYTSSQITYYSSGTYIKDYSYSSSPIVIDGTDYGSACSYSGQHLHDGNGGYYSYETYSSCVASGTHIVDVSSVVYTNISGTDYALGTRYRPYYHNGSGGIYTGDDYYYYTSYGATVVTLYSQPTYLYITQINQSFQNGTQDTSYYSDGNGGVFSYSYNQMYWENGLITEYYYQTNVNGQMHNNGAYSQFYYAPSWSGYYTESYYSYFYSYGTYIWDDGTYSYHWDGWGGYYSQQMFV